MDLTATIVEWGELGKTVVAAAVSGICVAGIFSLGVFGAARWIELQRQGRAVASAGAAALTIIALGAFTIAIVLGLIVMTDK
jgi:hypothetical protein